MFGPLLEEMRCLHLLVLSIEVKESIEEEGIKFRLVFVINTPSSESMKDGIVWVLRGPLFECQIAFV